MIRANSLIASMIRARPTCASPSSLLLRSALGQFALKCESCVSTRRQKRLLIRCRQSRMGSSYGERACACVCRVDGCGRARVRSALDEICKRPASAQSNEGRRIAQERAQDGIQGGGIRGAREHDGIRGAREHDGIRGLRSAIKNSSLCLRSATKSASCRGSNGGLAIASQIF
ncbi:hypothetical protein IE81DRAFT_255207 [Ceraceosorus guamensis]|uniref:Uncharacterized protein n=1 Tax=Ceraceosorus guamensis TaxID=1522189 RepID=A0A316VRM1_9BASI|nr:hypothetical protein IE81DRAFT_255207 [Ceraceosorus guamensis]PWN39864.1 hypothetical protein IE81DRAFT_255207 [Ceraceosorus guamensis]